MYIIDYNTEILLHNEHEEDNTKARSRFFFVQLVFVFLDWRNGGHGYFGDFGNFLCKIILCVICVCIL